LDEASNENLNNVWNDAEIARAVMEYLAEFPEAMDNVKGIAEWWLIRRNIRADVKNLSRVLGNLTSQGLLEQIGAGKGTRYRLKKPQN
jgi:hypothetical protein